MIASVRAACVWMGKAAVLPTGLLLLVPLLAADDTWALTAGQTGDWSLPANWSAARVPNSSDTAYVENGGVVTVTQTGELCKLLALGASGSGTLQLQSGRLATVGDEDLGGQPNTGNSGIGSVTQTGGTNSISGNLYIGARYSGTGTYSLMAGSLSASSEIRRIPRAWGVRSVGRNELDLVSCDQL